MVSMKKLELKRLAILGLTGGVIALSQTSLEGISDYQSIDMQHLIAKPSCKNNESCGGSEPSPPKKSTKNTEKSTKKEVKDKDLKDEQEIKDDKETKSDKEVKPDLD